MIGRNDERICEAFMVGHPWGSDELRTSLQPTKSSALLFQECGNIEIGYEINKKLSVDQTDFADIKLSHALHRPRTTCGSTVHLHFAISHYFIQ